MASSSSTTSIIKLGIALTSPQIRIKELKSSKRQSIKTAQFFNDSKNLKDISMEII
jgi:hypothetical protein